MKGFSLVGCLVALLLISLMATTIFRVEAQFQYHSQILQDFMQNENAARLVFTTMTPILQQVGYSGCRSRPFMREKMPISDWVEIIEGSADELPKHVTSNRVITSPVLKLIRANQKSALLHVSQVNDREITLNSALKIETHQTIVISDCLHTEVHRVNSVIKRHVYLDSPLFYSYTQNAEVLVLREHWYYIGKTQWHYPSGVPVISLYHYVSPGFHEALVYGVESWQPSLVANGMKISWKTQSCLPLNSKMASSKAYDWNYFIRFRNFYG